METVVAYHQRRANEHRKMAERTPNLANAHIHATLAGMHDAAAKQKGHDLTLVLDR